MGRSSGRHARVSLAAERRRFPPLLRGAGGKRRPAGARRLLCHAFTLQAGLRGPDRSLRPRAGTVRRISWQLGACTENGGKLENHTADDADWEKPKHEKKQFATSRTKPKALSQSASSA